jgi:large subunit ribosomal protein L4
MEVDVHSSQGAKSKVTIADAIFAAPYNEPLIHQVVTAYQARSRAGTKAQKNRGDVRGGGRKPWRQKGTGRARVGTTRGPLWRGGGRAFAARPRDFRKQVNRKMYRAAMRSILAELLRQGRLLVTDQIEPGEPRTKALLAILKSFDLSNVLIVAPELSQNLWLAARNVASVGLSDTGALDPLILLSYDRVLMTEGALRRIEAQLQ